MPFLYELNFLLALLPALVMSAAAWHSWRRPGAASAMWSCFQRYTLIALALCAASLVLDLARNDTIVALARHDTRWLAANTFGAWVSLLVQFLGTAIGVYSAQHLQGEPRQPVYITALAGVLASVHFLLLANHWVVLIAAWAAIEYAMHYLLCFYRNRPFALLAAHKKMVTDRAADVLLIAAAVIAWIEVGSASLTDLWTHIQSGQATPLLGWSSICLVLAVIARTALMPVHGWLVQVMEAPTPVSALLHAGVVNLGGYVLVLFAPLLGVSPAARWLLVIFGLMSAVVAGLVLMTRVSQKVHLAWSTIAQMGFMLLECGLGLYLFAALHLLGHSLYKAHNFLSASGAVQESQRKLITGEVENSGLSMILAVPISLALVFTLQSTLSAHPWPWWWTGILALAWAPLLWVPRVAHIAPRLLLTRLGTALAAAVFLTLAACVVDRAPVGATNDPLHTAGIVALIGMGLMYLEMVIFQRWPEAVITIRRWVYAGFYMDEGYTHWVLRFWPAHWANADSETVRVLSTLPVSVLRSPQS